MITILQERRNRNNKFPNLKLTDSLDTLSFPIEQLNGNYKCIVCEC